MKTQNPLIGRSTKSKGADTFYTLNGQNIVRNKPAAVSNPRTPAQREQRVRFTAFTEAANTVVDAMLNALYPSKAPRQNRRSTLQSQIAKAYSAQPTSDPNWPMGYEAVFDVTKLDEIGNGETGFVGELVDLTITDSNIMVSAANITTLSSRVVNTEDADDMVLCYVTEDGCTYGMYDLNNTFGEFKESEGYLIPGSRAVSHGNKVYGWVVKKSDKLQLIGLGTFSVAKRKASNRHNIIYGG